jgi:hypothetical protein
LAAVAIQKRALRLRLDCFASLAMTKAVKTYAARMTTLRLTIGRPRAFAKRPPARPQKIAIFRPKKVVPPAALGYGGGRSANKRDESHAA